MRQRYITWNGPIPTTGPQVKATTGTSTITQLQIGVPSGSEIEIVEWGVSFDGAVLGTPIPITIELIESTVAATVTARSPSLYGDPNAPASICVSGTAATGYTSSNENATANVRVFDAQLLQPLANYFKQFPLGERPISGPSLVLGSGTPQAKFVRLRTTAVTTAVNVLCYCIWAE